jgi:acyl carrier protein
MEKQAFLAKMAEILETDSVDESRQLANGGWDSLAVLSTIAFVDEEFGFTVPPDQLNACENVGALADLIRRSGGQIG